MMNLFKNQLNNVENQIINANDRSLFSENFESIILENNKVITPQLETAQTKVNIGEEIISFHNAPTGIQYSPGQTMEYALFTIPIIGKADLFSELIRGHINQREGIYIQHNSLIYKKYSGQKISGNDTVIENIKAGLKTFIGQLTTILNRFNLTVDQFNENDLKNHVTSLVARERERRNLKSNSESKLNPF